MDPSVVTQAQRGLDASWATPLKFWSARQHRTEKAEQALDQLQLHAEAKPAVELARAAAEQAPERKLELYRVALEALGQATTTAAAGPMAGLALKLLNETQLVGAKREEAAARLFDHTPTTLAVRTLLAETPAPQRLQLVHECATREAMALRLPDPRPLEVARESDAFQALPADAPHNELARSFLEHPDSWMASWLQAHRDHPQSEKLARWTIAQAPESDWKKHDDPLAVAMHIHQSYTVENLVKAALDSQHPEKWLGELRTQAQHRPQEGALNLVGELPAAELRKGLELIDKGANAGIKVGMVVLSTQGSLIGTVTTVNPNSAFVRLITDTKSKVNAQILESHALGILQGNPGRTLSFDLSQADAKVGDTVVTSGLGGNYPPGYAIGRVADVSGTPQDLFRKVKVEPLVRVSTVSTVLVLTSFVPQRIGVTAR